MRCAVLVDSDASVLGSAPAHDADPSSSRSVLAELIRALGFEVVPSFDDVLAGDTLLVHARGALGHGAWLRESIARIAGCEPESALVIAEVTHDGPSADALVAAEVVEAVRATINPAASDVGAIVAVRARSLDVDPIAFTKLVARVADRAMDANGCARLSVVTEQLRADADRHEAAQSYAVSNVDADFLIARSDRPSIPSLIALADGARDRAEWVHARAGYRAALMTAKDSSSRALAWSRIGAMERARCDEDEAMRAYENAAAASPTDREAIDALAELAEEAGDVKRAVVWSTKRVALIESPAEKVDELFAIARTYVQDLSDVHGAVATLERARAIEARDDVLEALRRSYRKLSDWPKLVEITGALADNAPTAEERAARRFAQARIALDRMKDATLAVGFLNLALDDDPTHDEALDVLVEVRTSLAELPELARALERVSERLDVMGEDERARDVRTRIAAIPRTEIIEAVDAVEIDADTTGPLESMPEHEADEEIAVADVDTGKRKAIAEQLLAEGDEGGALEELEAAISQAPLDVSLHERLFALHSRAERFDRALLAAQVLEEIAGPEAERDAWLEKERPSGALRVRALLDSTAWDLLRANGSDDVIESLFAAISKAAILAQVDDRRARRKLPSIDPARKQPKESTASIMASFRWAARVLGVECPNLYVLDDVPGDVAAVPAAEPSTVIGPSVLSGRSTKDLAFIVARHLTYYRPEHAVLLYFPTIQELTLLVLAAVQLAMPAVAIPPSVAAQVASLQARIAEHISDADRAKMTAAVERLEGRGGRLEIGTWVKSVEMTAARVGLVLSGDLRSAMTRVRAESRATSCVSVEEARADLVAFCASRAHADLRGEYALVTSSWPPPQIQVSTVRSRDDFATPTWNLMGDRAV
jgi:tetratricopeptide (TPR) repeat protein